MDSIKEMCDALDDSEQETMDIMLRLSNRYKDKKDSQANYKLSQEIEQLEIEYSNAQNQAQEIIDSKIVEIK